LPGTRSRIGQIASQRRSSVPDWVGWLLVGSMLLILVATAVAQDIPPLVYYGPTLLAGVMLYLHRP
jgi:hypothetical protein